MADGKVTIEVLLDDKGVTKGTKKVEGTLKGIGGAAKRGVATVGKLAGALGLVALAYKGIDMVKQSLDGAIDRYDTLNNFPKVMELIGFDAQTSRKAIDRLSDGIQGLPTRLDEVASTAQNIAVMTGDLDKAVETTLALNNAFLFSGSSSQDAARGLQQYTQMLAKGEVDLQSWRTLQETMGVALNTLAEQFGFTGASAQNDLYDALKEGEITFDEFNSKLIEASTAQDGFADKALVASGGIRTALTNMRTWVVMGVADILESIDEAMGGVGSIEGAMNKSKRIFQNVFGWIANTAVPWVANAITTLRPIFSAVFGWITDTVIPLVVAGFNLIKETIQEWFPTMDEAKEGFMSVFTTISEIAVPIFEEVVSFIMDLWSTVVEFWQEHGEMIIQAVQNMMNVIWGIMQFLWPAIQLLIIDTWNAIKNTVQGAIDVILGIIQFFSGLLTGDIDAMWDAIKRIFTGALQAVWGLINLWFVGKILKIGKSFISGLKNVISGGWNFIKNIFTTGVNAIRNVFSTGVNFIRNTATNVLNRIRSTFSNIFGGLRNIVSNAFGRVRSAVSNGMNRALSAVTNVVGKFKDAGKKIVTSIADGIKGAISKVTDAAKNLVGKVRNLLPFSPAKEGPLRDLNKLDFGGPIEDSLKKAIPNVQAELQALLNIGGPEAVLATPEPAIIDTGGMYEFTIVSEIDGRTLAKETVLYTAEELESLKKRDRRR